MVKHPQLKGKNEKIGAFVAHSFDERDKIIVGWIIDKLEKYFEVTTGAKPEAKTLTEKILPNIDKSNVFCGILTKRYHNDKDEWITSPWIYHEISYGFFSKKKMLLFVEEGIKDLGMIQKDYEYIPFKRESVEKKNGIEIKIISLWPNGSLLNQE